MKWLEEARKSITNPAGFTILELLVVVAILGMISTIAVAALSQFRSQAKVIKARADLSQIVKTIEIAREAKNKPLVEITNNGCSDCQGCRPGWGRPSPPDPGAYLYNISAGDPCFDWMNNNTFPKLGYLGVIRDPWGSPYLIDENEWEGGICNMRDYVFSAGPNGLDNVGGADDVLIIVPYYQCP